LQAAKVTLREHKKAKHFPSRKYALIKLQLPHQFLETVFFSNILQVRCQGVDLRLRCLVGLKINNEANFVAIIRTHATGIHSLIVGNFMFPI
jgi:hypothetical protein